LKSGRSRAIGPFRLQYRANGLDHVRLAQIVPKRMAKRAVDRNRLRRLVRERFRLDQARWAGFDCVLRLRSPYDRALDHGALARQLIEPGP
jgi:ribonuclease P protein component